MVLEIQRRSAADRAGLKSTRRNYFGKIIYGDVIISADDQAIKNNEDIMTFFENKKEGDEVQLRFMRQGKEHGTKAILQEL